MTRTDRWWLGAAVTVGALLRLLWLGQESLWLDEAYAVQLFGQGDDWWQAVATDTHPPVYPILMHLVWQLCGLQEWALRLPFALAGLAAVPLVWGIARELDLSDWSRRLGTLWVAVSPLLVTHSREARPHILFLLLALLSLWLLCRLQRRFDWRTAAFWCLTNVVLCYTHYLAGVFLLAEAFGLLLLRRRCRSRPLLALLFLSGLFFVPWLPTLWHQMSVATVQLSWLEAGSGWKMAGGLQHYLGLPRSSWGKLLGGAMIVIAAAGLLRAGLEDRARRLLGPWLVLGALVSLGLALAVSPLPLVRATLPIAPVVYLLAVDRLLHPGRGRGQVAVTLILAGWLTLSSLDWLDEPRRRPWREVAQKVQQESRGPEPLVFLADYGQIPYDLYHPPGRQPRTGVAPSTRGEELEQALWRGSRGAHRWWLVVSYVEDLERPLDAARKLGYQLEGEHRYHFPTGMALFHLERVDR